VTGRYRVRRQKIKAIEFHQLISPSVAELTRIPKEKFKVRYDVMA